MDRFIKEFIENCEQEENIDENISLSVHKRNIAYFSSLNYDSKLNIFDMLSLKVKYIGEEIIIIDNKSDIRDLTKGSRILKINGVHPLSIFDKVEMLNIEFRQKLHKREYIDRKLSLNAPILYSEDRNYETHYTNDILYIKINCFKKDQFRETIYKKNSFKKIIIDMRNNRGGLFSDMVNFLELFFEYNNVIMGIEVFDEEYVIRSKKKEKLIFEKIYIFVNHDTYSCAEIATHILHEKFGAIVLGGTTAGKLSIIKTYKLNFKYYTVPIGLYRSQIPLRIINISEKILDKWLEIKF